MRMPVLLLAVIVLVATAVAQDKTPKEPSGPPNDRVKALQKERVAALREAADISQKLATEYRAEVRGAVEDRMAALKAELEAVEAESDRTALRKQALTTLKEFEAVVRAGCEKGTRSQLDLLRVKARRLEIEIQLEQATAAAPKEP